MFLGIDLGSTVFKAEIFDAALRSVGRGASPVIYGETEGTRLVMPIEETEAAFQDAVAGALSAAGCAASDLEAIGITSQAQTFTLRTAEGNARWPFISWRGTLDEYSIPEESLPNFGNHTSFGECSPGLTVSKVAYLQQNSKGKAVAPSDGLRWLPTWFVEELTGRAVVDANLAAMSGLYSLVEENWWSDALQFCGLSKSNLPTLGALGDSAGLTSLGAARFGLPVGIPVVLAGNDQTAGAYGAAIHISGDVFAGLGTAQVVYACLPTLPKPISGLIRGPYPGGLFYRLGADSYGSATITWARTILSGLSDVKAFDAAVTEAPADCHGVRFIPDGPAGTGRWTGLDHPKATVADQARALMLVQVERLGELFDLVQAETQTQRVVLCGGGAASVPWRAMLAERFHAEMIPMPNVSPSLGAARMALDYRRR